MADDSFKRPDKIEYESIDQDPYDPAKQEEKPLDNKYEGEEEESVESTAAIVVDEYTRTIEFMKFLEGILRDTSKVEVELDPEDDPEVWMAMNRIFENPSPKMNQEAYFQVIDQLEVIEGIEQVEDNPRSEIEDSLVENMPDSREAEEGEIDDSDFQISAIDEVEQKAQVTRASAFREQPESPPPRPPKTRWWRRRWRKQFKKTTVLGKLYKIQWISGRWWKIRRK